jgi:hypothetical protein
MRHRAPFCICNYALAPRTTSTSTTSSSGSVLDDSTAKSYFLTRRHDGTTTRRHDDTTTRRHDDTTTRRHDDTTTRQRLSRRAKENSYKVIPCELTGVCTFPNLEEHQHGTTSSSPRLNCKFVQQKQKSKRPRPSSFPSSSPRHHHTQTSKFPRNAPSLVFYCNVVFWKIWMTL